MPRDNFLKRTKDLLAKRVAWHCSNPVCRAQTIGPSSTTETSFNIGVAAHITAASMGGPRYDSSLSANERSAYANGIWLCNNCGTAVDSDESAHTVSQLQQWKREAEEAAGRNVGKTVRISRSRFTDPSADLRHSAKMREDFERNVLKKWDLRTQRPPCKPYERFQWRELIVHRLGAKHYPDVDPSESGISSWFRIGLYDFYFEGIMVAHHLEGGILRANGEWSIEYGMLPDVLPDGEKILIRPLSMIPFRNIEHCKWDGDEYYAFPHIYCHFREQGTPYAGRKYVRVDGDKYEFELRPEFKIESGR